MSEAPGVDQIASLFKPTRTVWAIRAIVATVIGIIRIVQGFVDKELNGGGRAVNFIIGALILAGGVIVIRNPFETAVFIVLLIGIGWIFEGVATLIDTARSNGAGLSAVIAILIALAGVLVILFADGVTLAYAIFFGISLLVVGVLDLVLLFTVGCHLAKAKA